MDDNPWDFWLKTNVLAEQSATFENETDRLVWRGTQDIISNKYQQQYAEKRRQPQADTPWWQSYVSRSVISWTYLDGLEHPLDVPRLERETEQ